VCGPAGPGGVFDVAVSPRLRRQYVHLVWSRARSQGDGQGHVQVSQHGLLQGVQSRRRVSRSF